MPHHHLGCPSIIIIHPMTFRSSPLVHSLLLPLNAKTDGLGTTEEHETTDSVLVFSTTSDGVFGQPLKSLTEWQTDQMAD